MSFSGREQTGQIGGCLAFWSTLLKNVSTSPQREQYI